MRSEVDPAFENWDQDATVIADAYGAQDPGGGQPWVPRRLPNLLQRLSTT